jgi:hypothetical protein
MTDMDLLLDIYDIWMDLLDFIENELMFSPRIRFRLNITNDAYLWVADASSYISHIYDYLGRLVCDPDGCFIEGIFYNIIDLIEELYPKKSAKYYDEMLSVNWSDQNTIKQFSDIFPKFFKDYYNSLKEITDKKSRDLEHNVFKPEFITRSEGLFGVRIKLCEEHLPTNLIEKLSVAIEILKEIYLGYNQIDMDKWRKDVRDNYFIYKKNAEYDKLRMLLNFLIKISTEHTLDKILNISIDARHVGKYLLSINSVGEDGEIRVVTDIYIDKIDISKHNIHINVISKNKGLMNKLMDMLNKALEPKLIMKPGNDSVSTLISHSGSGDFGKIETFIANVIHKIKEVTQES